VNDGIPKQLCGLKYITVDDAINHILKLGHGTHLAKIDSRMSSAFYQFIQLKAPLRNALERWFVHRYLFTLWAKVSPQVV